ncbi:MAG: hypothetical protein IPK26_28485 [Planctomycetes bacterium]|nr:hypothetical protein [Planctomycetota bacterium]
MRLTLTAVLPAVLAALPAQQQPIGSTFRTANSVNSRGGVFSSQVTLIARFDRADYVGWGKANGLPGVRQITGVTFQSTDNDGSSAESWSVVIFTEDLANRGYPLVTAPVATFGPFTNAVRPAGAAGFTHTITFAPVSVPDGADVFVGVQLATVSGWPTNGHAVNCLLGNPTRWPTYDQPGAAPIEHMGYGLAWDGVSPPVYNTPRQLLIDILHDAPGAAATAITNQTSLAISNTAPGTGSFLSGLHPDATNPPFNPGRADDVSFVYLDTQMPNGTPVFFLADFGNFGAELPFAGFVPGSIGALCLNPVTASTMGFQVLAGGQTSMGITIPAAIRPTLSGLALVRQAVALTPTLTLRGSPCGRQVF